MSLLKIESYLFNFTKKETEEFLDYLDSPFFNSKKSTSKITQFLINNKRDISKNGLDFLKNSSSLKKYYNTTQLKKELFNIGAHLENFIYVKQNAQENKMLKQNMLASFCAKKGFSKLYESYDKKIQKEIEQTKIRDSDFFNTLYKIEVRRQEYNAYYKDIRSKDNNIQKVLNCLDSFYLLEKIKCLNIISDRKKAVSLEYDFRLKNEVLKISNDNVFANINAIRIQKLIYLIQVEKNPQKYFYEITEVIKKDRTGFNKTDLNNVLVSLINSARLIFSGNDYYREVLNLYKLQIELDLMIGENNLILVPTYKNVITIALNLSETEWAEKFLNTYVNYLPKKLKNEIYYYNLASINFDKNNFSLALENLNQSFPKDSLILLSVKRLYLKIFYELTDLSLLDSSIHSLNMYIRRLKSSSKNHIKFNKLFLKYFKSLASLKLNPNKTKLDLQNLLVEVENEPVLPEKRWILEKINAEIK